MREFCVVCNHEHCTQIEADFRECKCWHTVARKYGLGVCNIYEHMKVHAAREPEPVPDAPKPLTAPAGFQDSIVRLARIALDLVEDAVRRGKSANDTSRALQEALRQLAFVAKIYAPHKQPKSVQEKFIHTPEWGRIRTLILEAIWPFPDARAAVSKAMEAAQANDTPPAAQPT